MDRKKNGRKQTITCENRYKYKLNMLWPGRIMSAAAGALLLA